MKFLFLLLFFIPFFAGAQISHKVQPKETLYSLARKYNVHPRELAEFNNIPVNKGLELGQIIKIPTKTHMDPLPPVGKTPELVKEPESKPEPVGNKTAVTKPTEKGKYPMYHKVEKKETLYRISKMYPGVTLDDIRKWNDLTGDGLSEGMNLIVGYSNNPSAIPEKVAVEEVEKNKPEPVLSAPEKSPALISKKEEPVKETVSKETKSPESTNPMPVRVIKSEGTLSNFKTIYNQQINNRDVIEEKGQSGIFKSTSGWEDGKYYCLSNTVPAGAIVKITNTINNKVIYARVLDLIPDLKQNAGMILRLSNAGASELGVSSDSFDCVINY
ncbi:MAG: LysM peptidoglycan-binding domain-containing protein [Chitinophagaceae bacterium]|nr:LysM peptidoglycan-binding domain-containing protein [Bacteroidota bacterium]MCC6258682.1 LysM peptidoglycan-binding domain-containing protein [Chitinophagaceae bacterium]MCW5917002.1 LysM peptidoglycan-binding domain-containing protein [Ferruginibacter sp.]